MEIMNWIRKHRKGVIFVLLTIIAIMFYFGYTITADKQVKKLITEPASN